MNRRSLLALVLFLALCPGAAAAGPGNALRVAVEQVAADPATTVRGEYLFMADAVYRFYTRRGFEPAWTTRKGLNGAGRDLQGEINAAGSHGLRPVHYHAEAIRGAVRGGGPDRVELELLLTDAFLYFATNLLSGHVNPETIDPEWVAARRERDMVVLLENALGGSGVTAALASVLPQHAGYTELRDALARYRSMPAWDVVSDGDMLRRGDSGERVAAIRRRLAAGGYLDDGTGQEFDAALESALRAFQSRHGLGADGVVGPATIRELNVSPRDRALQLVVNLERWRWLPQDLGDAHITVNIADFSLEAVAPARPPLRMKVVVGRSYRRTPVFSGRMSYIVVNPWWEVPRYLAVEDHLPLIRAEADYLERMGMKVYGAAVDGEEVGPAGIDWSRFSHNYFPYRLRQAPGLLNALGRYKFMFPNKFSVYLHDTPARYLFAKPQRAFSSGCIRVEDPDALAEFLVAGSAEWPVARVAEAVASGETITINLATRIPVHLLYWTAWSEDGVVQFRPDVYGRDVRVLAALGEDPPDEPSEEVSP